MAVRRPPRERTELAIDIGVILVVLVIASMIVALIRSIF